MAAQTNGRAKKPKKATPNGTSNGHMNGYANGHVNGHLDKAKPASSTSRSSPKKKKPGRSITGALMSITARLAVWYTIITLLLRCPPTVTQISDSSPVICKPYLQGRSYAAPYLNPYYQTYIAPYAEKVKPHVDRFETQVYAPAASFAQDKYATYGAHRVEHAKQYIQTKYEGAVRPQLNDVQKKAKDQYNVYLASHVKKALEASSPYYEQIKASLDEIYHLSVLPAYEASLPYLRVAHAHGHHILVDFIFPHVRSARDAVGAFIIRTVWPQVRILYGDNVEPQLVRISERLGRYRDQQKVEAAVDAVDSQTPLVSESFKTIPTIAASTASEDSSSSATKQGWGVFDNFLGGDSARTASSEVLTESASAAPVAEQKLSGPELEEKLNQDLRKWQTKFATAADKGAEDLEQRVTDITKRQVDSAVHGHGRALVVKLEETADSTITTLKSLIKRTIKSIPEDVSEEDLESAYQELGAKTRQYGLTVKERAQNVRAWKAAYDQETDSLVQAAVVSTVEVLEKIHGLGLQEVGMRWAWTDGVTYKDWQNYHKLRDTLNEWQAEVEAVGSKHDGLRVAHEEAKKVEDEAMKVAANIVAELVRLKNVSKWKLWAGDATDDFSDKKVPARIFKAAQQAKRSAEAVASQVSEAVQGSSTPLAEDVASSVKDAYSDASSKVAEVVQGSSTPLSESMASSVKSALSEASSVAYESPKKVFGGANAQILAEAKQVVFDQPLDDDEDETYSNKLGDMAADAGDRVAELSRLVSEALLGPSRTQGTVQSMSSLASEQYAQALAAASSVLYGTEQPAIESATSVASEKFAQAVTAASYAIYGTPKPTAIIRTMQIQASSRYNGALRLASEQLEGAKSQLSILVSGTPQPAHQTMLSYFDRAYSDSVAAASERLSAALQYTETVKNYAAGPTQGYLESISSIASSRLAEGISQASARFSPSQPTGALDGAQRQYYEAIGLAHARYSEFVGAASSAVYGPQQGIIESLASVASVSAASAASYVSDSAQSAASYVSDSAQSAASNAQEVAGSLASSVSSGVIGTETPWTESVASEASANWEALITRASNQVYGKPTPWANSVYSQAGAYGAQATAVAARQYADVQALISELVIGKEPDFTESVMQRFASAYYTGVPAAVSSAQSYANEQFEAASSYAGESYEAATAAAADVYASASSVVSSVFTPPAVIEDVLSQASASLDLAIESASIALYGTPKGAAAKASESVASAYASIQSQVSVQVYGTQAALDNFQAAAASAQAKISEAIFGTPTAADYVASATSGAGGVYSSISSIASVNAEYAASVASSNAAYASSAISSAVYGPEQGAMESANSRIAAAVEAANSKIAEMYAAASQGAGDAASSVVSAATQATQRVKDEL